MKKLAIWLLFAVAAYGSQTHIVDTLHNADGTNANGSLTISWPALSSMVTGTVVKNQKTYQVVNGVIDLYLEANSTSSPANTSYTVQYSLKEGTVTTTYKETWVVPASDTSVTVRDIRQQPSALSAVNPVNSDQLTGLQPGDIIVGTNTVPVKLHAPQGGSGVYCLESVAGSNVVDWVLCGSGTTLSWDTLIYTQWAAMTASQWAQLRGGSGGSNNLIMSWTTMSSAQWSSLTATQWSQLTN